MRAGYSIHARRELLADNGNTALVGSRSAAQPARDGWNRQGVPQSKRLAEFARKNWLVKGFTPLGIVERKDELLAIRRLGGIRRHEAQHLLLQLRIHFIRDRYNIGKQRAKL